jgi:hypothetical protein
MAYAAYAVRLDAGVAGVEVWIAMVCSSVVNGLPRTLGANGPAVVGA